jgi:hypothetical protein
MITKQQLYLKAAEIALTTIYQKTGINQVKEEEAIEAIETVYKHLTNSYSLRSSRDKTINEQPSR